MPALRDLDRAECERLLRGSTFGRVVLVTPEGPDDRTRELRRAR